MTKNLLVGVDWVGISFPLATNRPKLAAYLAELGVFFGDDWIGNHEDGDRYTAVGGRSARQGDRLRVDLSGGFWPVELAAAVAAAMAAVPGAKLHRLDLAVEPPHGDRLYRFMRAAAKRGDYAGFEKTAVVESWAGGEPAGETLYLGSRESPSFSRYYRKVGRERWRFEREFKRERAGQAVADLAAKPNDPVTLRRWAFGGIIFGNREKSHGHRDRIEPFRWWRQFSGCEKFQQLPPLDLGEKSLERSLAWVESQVAPTLKTLQAAGYGDRLRDVISSAKLKPAIAEYLRQSSS